MFNPCNDATDEFLAVLNGAIGLKSVKSK